MLCRKNDDARYLVAPQHQRWFRRRKLKDGSPEYWAARLPESGSVHQFSYLLLNG